MRAKTIAKLLAALLCHLPVVSSAWSQGFDELSPGYRLKKDEAVTLTSIGGLIDGYRAADGRFFVIGLWCGGQKHGERFRGERLMPAGGNLADGAFDIILFDAAGHPIALDTDGLNRRLLESAVVKSASTVELAYTTKSLDSVETVSLERVTRGTVVPPLVRAQIDLQQSLLHTALTLGKDVGAYGYELAYAPNPLAYAERTMAKLAILRKDNVLRERLRKGREPLIDQIHLTTDTTRFAADIDHLPEVSILEIGDDTTVERFTAWLHEIADWNQPGHDSPIPIAAIPGSQPREAEARGAPPVKPLSQAPQAPWPALASLKGYQDHKEFRDFIEAVRNARAYLRGTGTGDVEMHFARLHEAERGAHTRLGRTGLPHSDVAGDIYCTHRKLMLQRALLASSSEEHPALAAKQLAERRAFEEELAKSEKFEVAPLKDVIALDLALEAGSASARVEAEERLQEWTATTHSKEKRLFYVLMLWRSLIDFSRDRPDIVLTKEQHQNIMNMIRHARLTIAMAGQLAELETAFAENNLDFPPKIAPEVSPNASPDVSPEVPHDPLPSSPTPSGEGEADDGGGCSAGAITQGGGISWLGLGLVFAFRSRRSCRAGDV